jgi:phage host-nuclease inhibitor protein Gam
MSLAALEIRESEERQQKVENFLTEERATLFADLEKVDAEAGADLKRLRRSLKEPKIKLNAATRALDSAKRMHRQITQEVTEIDVRITEIFNRQRHQQQKLHARILELSPVVQDFVKRLRDEMFGLEQGEYATRRVDTGRRNALGDPEIVECNNSQSVAGRRLALISARHQAEKLAVTIASEPELQQRLDDLYGALPAIAIPTFKKDET